MRHPRGRGAAHRTRRACAVASSADSRDQVRAAGQGSCASRFSPNADPLLWTDPIAACTNSVARPRRAVSRGPAMTSSTGVTSEPDALTTRRLPPTSAVTPSTRLTGINPRHPPLPQRHGVSRNPKRRIAAQTSVPAGAAIAAEWTQPEHERHRQAQHRAVMMARHATSRPHRGRGAGHRHQRVGAASAVRHEHEC